MLIVLITALGVGGATAIGALIGFLFKGLSHNAYYRLFAWLINKLNKKHALFLRCVFLF